MFQKLLAVKYVTRWKDGVSYDAIEVCNLENGLTAKAQVNHRSNIEGYLHKLFGEDWTRTYDTKVEMKSREYHAFVKGIPYVYSYDTLVQWLGHELGFEYNSLKCICNDTDSFCPVHNGHGVEIEAN